MNQGYGKYGTHAPIRAILAVLTCTAALAACGGPADPAARTDAKPSAAPKPLAQPALAARSLAPGAEAGPYRTGEYTVSGGPLSDAYTAKPPACQSLVSLRSARGGPVAQVHRRLTDPKHLQGADVAVQLRSYGKGRAAAVMGELRTAGKACAGGFTEVRGSGTGTYTSVAKAVAPAGAGDEAVAYRLGLKDGPGRSASYEYLTVVRYGATLVSFRAENLDGKDLGGVPKEIVDAQTEKFSSPGK
ncbi:lipoprotein [Streptomyces spiroverticillatus]|uniref:Lipoprotein n=1 Tax=Streptomyces finlayi TaxID=67296 RepID=A0A918X2F6_9ACTN|nr:hypothetical protein [Streptomyces finlayi]GHA25606.1 lipoprotein [Streptomyces spiroverticillatus]GHD05301.1 lipoprotein [Streptomyces finlayi]